MKTNKKPVTRKRSSRGVITKTVKKVKAPVFTHEGGPARPLVSVNEQLERLVATCMLFEQTFYESGDVQADNIAKACVHAKPQEIADLAIKAREFYRLRHVPLWLLVQLNKKRAAIAKGDNPSLIRRTVERVVQRPDEAAELLKLLAKDSGKSIKKSMSHSIEKGLAAAMRKFSEYQLSKWNRKDVEVKLRDVLFLTHSKPSAEGRGKRVEREYKNGTGVVLRHSKGQAGTFKQLVEDSLPVANTWETALSSGADKKATWTRLLEEGKLGYIALLMNLRNMVEAKVSKPLIEKALLAGAPRSKALPFRFLSAEKHAPEFSGVLSDAMISAVAHVKGSLPGSTAILVDVSGSMDYPLASKASVRRIDAAASMAILAKEVCESSSIFSFEYSLHVIKNSRGIPLRDEIMKNFGGGTALGTSIWQLLARGDKFDRVIAITDEQTSDLVPPLPKGCEGWIINVAGYEPTLALPKGTWRRLNGFSDRIFDFIKFEEGLFNPEETESVEE